MKRTGTGGNSRGSATDAAKPCELMVDIGIDWWRYCFGIPPDSIMLGTVRDRRSGTTAALLLNEASDCYERCLHDVIGPLDQRSVERALGIRDPVGFPEPQFRSFLAAAAGASRDPVNMQFSRGFRRGLRQRYHARFATEADHEHCLALARSPNRVHRALAEGYWYATETPLECIHPNPSRILADAG